MTHRGDTSAILFKRRYVDGEIILLSVRWYLTYKLSYRDLKAIMADGNVNVAHTTILRWVQRYVPEFAKRWQRYARPVGRSWRIDETYIKSRGKWSYLYRGVVRSVPSKWRQARDEGLRPHRSLITWTL